ncbi:MAG: NAD(P)-dependent oxidoreductase [Chitinophagaceae bacterium]
MKQKVLITGNIPNEWTTELEAISTTTIWQDKGNLTMPRKDLLAEIGEYDGLVNFAEVKADAEFIQSAHKLRIIANASIGFDNLNLPLLTSKKIWASNAPAFFNYPVAEYVFAGILAISRRLLEADDFVRNGNWNAFEPGRWDGISLKEKTVGIIGMGSIGKELRRMIQGMGARVVYFTPLPKEEEGWVSFEELISMSDIISIHVPLTPKTINLLNSEVIAKIKEGAIIANASRGLVMDEMALIKALKSGKIGGAVLDVFRDEPNVPEDLKKMKNVLLTPHMAGGTKSAREACLRRAIHNVAEGLTGSKPINALNDLVQTL